MAERTEWMAKLETIARHPPDECNAEWEWLMKELGLAPEYFLAIYEAVRQGRWRTARDPKAYLKTVAKREATEMELPAEGDARLVFPGETKDGDGGKLSQEERLGYMQHELDSVEPLKRADGVWRPGGGLDAYYKEEIENEDENLPERACLSRSKVTRRFTRVIAPPKALAALINEINASTNKINIQLRLRARTDWRKWARAAGLDQWERKVLDYKLKEVSRDCAMKAQLDESSRKSIQAAWRRFDRNGIKRLVTAAQKSSVENVPE
jgi:hypothetical protein